MSLTMAAVEAAAKQDPAAMRSAAEAMVSLSAQDVFGALGQLFSMIGPNMKPEQREIVRAELGAASGPDRVRAAVIAIGTPLIVDSDPTLAGQAIARQAAELANDQELWAGAIWETVEAAGRASGRIGMTFNLATR
jgi:hypothetical protein